MLSGTSVKPPQLDEFFLDYDLKLRREEVARLGLAICRALNQFRSYNTARGAGLWAPRK